MRSRLLSTSFALWLAFVTLGGIAPLGAQQSTPPDSARVGGARPIPATAIVDQARAVELRMVDIEFLLAPTDAIGTIEREAIPYIEELGKEAAEPLPPAGWSTRMESNLARLWGRREQQLAGWRTTVTERVRDVSMAVAELDSLVSIWDATTQDTTLPEVLANRAITIGRGAMELRTRASDRLEGLLTLETTVADGHRLARTRRNTLVGLVVGLDKSLLKLDAPPLWSLRAWQGGWAAAGSLPDAGERLQALRQGIAKSWILHLFMALLLFGIINSLRRAIPEPYTGAHANALSRPISATVLVSLMASFWMHPLAPVGLYDILIVAAVIPLFRIAQVVFPAGISATIVGISALAVAHRIAYVWISGPLTGRLVLAVGALLLALGLRYLSRQDGPLAGKGWARVLRRVAQIGLVLAVIGLAANLIGMVALAYYLTNGLILAGFATPAIFSCAMVLEGTLTLGLPRVPLETIRQHQTTILRWGTPLVRLLVLAAWVDLTLLVFRLTTTVVGSVGGILGAKIPLGVVTISLGNFLLFITTVWLGWALGRALSTVLEIDILGRIDLPRGAAATIGTLFRYTFVAAVFVLAIAAVGVELTQLAIIGGALGVGIGFGMQSVVNNFMSGLILAFERPIAVGDTVQLTNLQGVVANIGLRATTIRAFDGSEVIVPNADLTSREVINWTKTDVARRLEIPVGVAYGSDPNQVATLLARLPSSHKLVSSFPAPVALFTGFGESSLDFAVRFWTDSPEFPQVRSEVALAIHDALKQAGFQIPFPQRDVHLHQAAPRSGNSGTSAPGA
jgi:potassium efflux system protein